MFTAEQIRQQLQDANLRKVAERMDLNYMTIYRFMQGETNPPYSTVKALSDYLVERSQVTND
jgi:predicted transcriptional regulator